MLALLLVQEGEFTPFSINTGLIFWTVVVFGILLALLWRFGWPALLKTVEDRERRIQQQLEEAERARAEAARLLEEHKRTIAGAKAEAQEIVARAKAVADKERETLLAKARHEYDQLLERARCRRTSGSRWRSTRRGWPRRPRRRCWSVRWRTSRAASSCGFSRRWCGAAGRGSWERSRTSTRRWST